MPKVLLKCIQFVTTGLLSQSNVFKCHNLRSQLVNVSTLNLPSNQIWNDFINRTEEEQQRILGSSAWCRGSEATVADNSKAISKRELQRQDSWDMVQDNRTGDITVTVLNF